MPSRVIHGMRYLPGLKALDVVFRNTGETYRYFDVTGEEWREFKRAPSKAPISMSSSRPVILAWSDLRRCGRCLFRESGRARQTRATFRMRMSGVSTRTRFEYDLNSRLALIWIFWLIAACHIATEAASGDSDGGQHAVTMLEAADVDGRVCRMS